MENSDFNHEFDDLVDKAKQSFRIIFSNIASENDKDFVNPKDYGFESEDDMLLHYWDLLDPQDQEHLRRIGLNPNS